ncbi:hypothetical protein PDESU_01472 [Pontiella desulfatans]|uniref:PEP-CTERM protein-sorting domain-containing protein n=1 Tax=Pontiella desulfatans TaxID=2750659 RepID=A0A6C2TYX2_PONDE|nr:PEP-CTERM sorting domain-containing protein [Pontiella desulfatans]VGO12918.1 hypothetical protein PDESU_01472 [Pontiella desulfatans]
MMHLKKVLTVCCVIGFSSCTFAGIITSTDQADFSLVSESFTYTPNATYANINSLSGNMTLQTAAGVGNPATAEHFYRAFATSVMAGNVYALNNDENFNVLFNSNQSAFAFRFEDNADVSLFTLEFFNGATSVGSTQFYSNLFNTPRFIGFSSDTVFNMVTVRENDGGANSNEYFQFYTAEAIPEPGTIALVGIFGGGLWFVRRYFPSV